MAQGPKPILAMLAGMALLLAPGCLGPQTRSQRSGLMDYLYPKRDAAPVPDPAGARLTLPLKLGVVFVPSASGSWRVSNLVTPAGERPLLDVVKEAFKGKSWVGEIKVIPSSYLTARGGFDNLDQVSRMYGVDVMALVSVDQIQYTDPKWYSFAYLSIVGAYVLPGDSNDTRTLIDAAVFHVPTRTFLLRAPGQSVVKGSSTLVNREERLRANSSQGLELAMKELAKNLETEVEVFKAQVASGERKGVDVIDRQGQSLKQTGGKNFGGSFGGVEVLAGLALAAALWRRRR
ncbi:MAG: rhombotarget lipoprotein [Holophaga sp.]|nr:rhombotarget lipoprotein [Holophaga sp.]